MCEYWMYGCGHAVRTPCPRPKPITTNTSAGTGGSIGSNASSSNQGSPRRGSNNTNSSSNISTFSDLTPISKFCNGFPFNPKETTAPCYNCILADAKRKIQLEKPEVEAKKAELRRDGMARTIARGSDGRYVDEFGNKIIAEDEHEHGSEHGGRSRERSFTGGRGNGRHARIDHAVNGFQDRRNSAAGAFAGNGGFRGGARGGAFLNGFGPHRHGHNVEYGSGGGGFQAGHGTGLPNGCGPPYDNYGQQYFQPDLGGTSWGQAGGLGSGLDAGGVYHQQDMNHFNGRRF